MVSTTLLAGSLLTILEGFGYVLVGSALARRQVAEEARFAARLFVSWWILIGVNKLLAATTGLSSAYGWTGNGVYVGVIYINVVILCASLWCLLSYLGFLLTGRRGARAWAGALYVGYYVLLTYHIYAGGPTGAGFGEWRTYLISRNEAPPLRGLLVLALLVLPQFLAAVAYLTLVFRVRERATRARVLLVGASVIGWTISILLVSLPAFEEHATWQVASRIVGFGSAVLALLAYRPPIWLRRVWGVGAGEAPGAPPVAGHPHESAPKA